MPKLLAQPFAPGIQRTLTLSMMAIAAAFLCLGFFFHRAFEQHDRAEQAQSQAAELVTTLRENQQHLIDLETGERGFLLTGNDDFLEPTRAAQTALTKDQARLRAATPENAERLRLIERLIQEQTEYDEDWISVIIDTARRDRDLATQMVATGEGKRRMDSLRALINEIAADEQADAAAAQAQSQAAQDRAKAVGAIALGLAILTAGLGFYQIQRRIVTPLHHLALGARRIAGGDLTTRVPVPKSKGEVGRLVRDFNKMAAALQESEQVKEDFIALVSHELRTPLTAIIGYMEVLLDDELGELTAEQRDFLEVIDRNAKRLLRLVGDLLFVAQIDNAQLSIVRAPMQLHKVAAASVRDIQDRAEAKQIDVSLEAEPLEFIGDADRICQVIDNLLTNAVKFTPEYGQVHVAVREAGNYGQIIVADSGMGIAPADQKKIFQRFYRTREVTDQAIAGTGLGLVITKSIVEAHGGTIEVTSTQGEGSIFTVELPLTRHIGKATSLGKRKDENDE